MAGKVADFSGWATKAGLKCADGRTIMPDAFADQDGQTVPLFWQHGHNDPTNILGHAVLTNHPEGVRCEAFFNDSEKAQNAKLAIKNGDINQMSIYANKLVEKAKQVIHGKIREVSLVIAGANPGALIDTVAVQHSDGYKEIIEDEAVIYTGESLELAHAEPSAPAQESGKDQAQKIWDSMTEEQQQFTEFLVESAAKAAVDSSVQHSDSDENEEAPGDEPGDQEPIEETSDSSTTDNPDESSDGLDNQEGSEMTHNVFDQDATKTTDSGYSLTHSDIKGIFKKAEQLGSVKEAVEQFALQHGIDDIEVLFPDAKSVTQTPDFLARRTEWVSSVMTDTRKTPFSRIKSLMADLTLDAARAKGYIKGTMKREEFFRVSKRVTTPQTIYKKQKLDRDDILDITDFDVVVWLKAELRLMLEEEVARAVLIGDGRSLEDDDKIQEDKIRPIATDNELYATTVYVNVAADNSNWDDVVDQLILQRSHYRGSGNPVFYTTETALARMLLIKDSMGRRIYATAADLAAAIRCSKIIAVEVMEQDASLVGILVNLQDYTIGSDKGGELSMFDFFDIDFNQNKYLLETRMSGALTKPKSALVVRQTADADVLAEPLTPTFDGTTVTIPNDANTVYKRSDTGATLAGGATVTLDATTLPEVTITADPAAGKYFATNDVEWTYQFEG